MITRQSDRPNADDFEAMLAQLGGARALRDDPNDFRKAVERGQVPACGVGDCQPFCSTKPQSAV